jgi:hypothetical protein
MISDADLRRLENAMTKALFMMLLNSDELGLKSASFTEDDTPTLKLSFGDFTSIVVTISAKEEKTNE